jgi:hypothetical protein
MVRSRSSDDEDGRMTVLLMWMMKGWEQERQYEL